MLAAKANEAMSRPSYDLSMSKDPYTQFLTELKDARIAQGLSQSELAGKIKLSRAQYTAIENGRSMITFAHMHNLSVALKKPFTVGKKGKEKKK
jgi:transcriptional regulator with XRE-family HTH domain